MKKLIKLKAIFVMSMLYVSVLENTVTFLHLLLYSKTYHDFSLSKSNVEWHLFALSCPLYLFTYTGACVGVSMYGAANSFLCSVSCLFSDLLGLQ
jgi:hypothetical protein